MQTLDTAPVILLL